MKTLMMLVSFVGLLTTLYPTGVCQEPLKKSDVEVAKQFTGKWKGTMKSPVFQDFPVEINIQEFKAGKWCAELKHVGPLNADGKMLGIRMDGKSMVLAQTIFRGREDCMDGLNVLTLIDENTIERVWYDPETGEPRDKGTLKRQK